MGSSANLTSALGGPCAAHWHAGYNLPGCLPDAEPGTYSSFGAARESLASDMADHGDAVESWADEHDCDDVPCPTYGDDCAAQRAGNIRAESEALLDSDGVEWSGSADGLAYWIRPCNDIGCVWDLVAEELTMPRFFRFALKPTRRRDEKRTERGDALVKTVGMATVRDDPSTSSIRPRLAVAAAVLVLAGLVGGACSSGGGEPTVPTSAAAARTTTTAKTQEAIVLDAYRHYWDVFIAVGAVMDPADPRLAEVATGEALAQLHSSFAAARLSGLVARGTIDLAPKVAGVQGDEALIDDCYANHIVDHDAATGKPKGHERPDRVMVTVGMRREAGTWKVAGIRPEGYGCTPAG